MEKIIGGITNVTRLSFDHISPYILATCRYIMLPLNTVDMWHWHLLVFDIMREKFLHYDSIKSPVAKRTAESIVSTKFQFYYLLFYITKWKLTNIKWFDTGELLRAMVETLS